MTVTSDLNALASDDPEGAARSSAFQVHLDVFEGPFDLLLALISKHKLDITEVALSQVTDEFISYISERTDSWDLDQVSYFLVVAATLLDLKAARLLPAGEADDEDGLALLEARDLLFVRLRQSRASKAVAAEIASRMAAAGRRFPRRVPMEPRFVELLPEVLLGLGPVEFAAIAARALTPKLAPVVSTEHLHMPITSVREQVGLLSGRLARLRRATFRQLTSDCGGTYEVIARFLAVLELYRRGRIALDQAAPLGDLYVSWTAPEEDDGEATDQDEGEANDQKAGE